MIDAVPEAGAAAPRAGLSRREIARGRLWLTAAAVAGFLPALAIPLRHWLDFAAFYAGGHFAGTRQLYDLGALVRWQDQNGMLVVPFVYPASVAVLYAPLAALPYGIAAALHLALMTAALVLGARIWGELLGIPRAWATLGALAWAPAAASAVSGQNATLILLLVGLAARALSRPGPPASLVAGVLAGIAAAKPQLGAAVGVVSAVRGGLAALAGLAIAGIGHYLLGVAGTGGDFEWPRAWLGVVSRYSREDLLANGWQATSLPTLGSRLSVVLDSPIPAILGWALAIALAGWCVRGLGRLSSPAAIAVGCAAGVVLSPHAWVYDSTLLLPGLGVLAVEASRRGWPVQGVRGFVAAYALAAAWPFGWLIQQTPVIAIAVGVAVALGAIARDAPATVSRRVAP